MSFARRRSSSTGGIRASASRCSTSQAATKKLEPQQKSKEHWIPSGSNTQKQRRHTVSGSREVAFAKLKDVSSSEKRKSLKKDPIVQKPLRASRSNSAISVKSASAAPAAHAQHKRGSCRSERSHSATNLDRMLATGTACQTQVVNALDDLKAADICSTATKIEKFAHGFALDSATAPPEGWQDKLKTFVDTFSCPAEDHDGQCKTSQKIVNEESLLERATFWVNQSIELLRDLGVYKRSKDLLGKDLTPPGVKVDSSPSRPPVACYRSWTHKITFGWSGSPWSINVVKLVAAHETWHAVQHMLWGHHHDPCPIIRHQAFEGSAVLFMAICVCCQGWKDTLPTFVDYILGKSAQAVGRAHVDSGAWTTEDANEYQTTHKGCCPLGGKGGANWTLAYVQSTVALAHGLNQLKLSPQERLLALMIAPLDAKHKCSSVLAKIRGSVRWLRQCPKTAALQKFVWPTDSAAPTVQVMRGLQDIFIVDKA